MRNKIVLAVLIILVLGAIGAVIFVSNRSNKTANISETKPMITPGTIQTMAVDPNQKVGISGNTGFLNLFSLSGAGKVGYAQLAEENGKAVITITLTGQPQGSVEPAHFHLGSCPLLGDIKYTLQPITNGTSKTIMNISLTQLKKELPLALNIKKSSNELTNSVACGDLNDPTSPAQPIVAPLSPFPTIQIPSITQTTLPSPILPSANPTPSN